MTSAMLWSQVDYIIIIILSGTISYMFYKMRDGILRIIMIFYFACVALDYWFEQAYFLAWDLGHFHNWDEPLVRAICHTPKAVAMIWLFWYLRGRGDKTK